MPVQKDKRYIRTAPQGEETIVIVKDEKEVEYHDGLEKEGYKYKEVVPAQVIGGTCTACEG